MHQRAALQTWENGAVDFLSHLFAVGQNDAATWATQALVCGGGHDIGIRHGVGVDAASDQA